MAITPSWVVFDYDDMTLQDVLADLFRIAPLWFDYATKLSVYRTSEGNYHAVIETVPILQDTALDILNASKCSLDYKAFVAERGFTRRVSAKNGKPAPKLLFSVDTGKHYEGDIWRSIKHPCPPRGRE